MLTTLQEQIRKADRRLSGWDPSTETVRAKNSKPDELNSDAQLQNRRRFLTQSLGEKEGISEFHERIIQGNELQDVNYLSRGARAAQAVARVAIREPSGRLGGYGSGFLVTPRLFLTNHHVLPARESSLRSAAEFRYERDIAGTALAAISFGFAPDDFFFTSEALDFTVVGVAPTSERDGAPLAAYGYLPLVETLGKVVLGEWLTIVQHPNGERKQVCVRENQLIRIEGDVIWYSTDTLGGSSGSPVFNNDWIVVGLHHSGVPERKDGRIQTIDGRDWDEQRDSEDQIKWQANEGIRVSRIVQTLREAHAAHPLLGPVFRATPAEAHGVTLTDPSNCAPSLFTTNPPPTTTMNTTSNRHITVHLEITPEGGVTLLPSSGASLESALLERRDSPAPRRERVDVPFDATYQDRQGFVQDLLGNGAKHLNLPILGPDLVAAAAKLLPPAAPDEYELRYHNVTIVMHKKRRLAIYSAASVRGDQRYELDRTNYADESAWRRDPRIPAKAQLENFYYKGNRFDRGHLSRNEDLEFGSSPTEAIQSALDTFHYTNIAPQHDAFNRSNIHKGDDRRGLDIALWGQLEKHILEQSIFADEFAAQIFSGPILDEGDPIMDTHPDIPYPVRFWKVLAALDSETKKLFATAFLLDQSDVIGRFGLDEAAPIGAFKTYQVPIAEIERLTGLAFTSGVEKKVSLSKVDPLESRAVRRRRGRSNRGGFDESTSLDLAPDGYLLVEDFSQIVTTA
ncbi:MAG TPA: DNA/RNA non-specific endonuclease [Chthoniobacterales bacterium]|nr:DNA/RNA non-specific endonuclease [Chthoniobacterales bacterium]